MELAVLILHVLALAIVGSVIALAVNPQLRVRVLAEKVVRGAPTGRLEVRASCPALDADALVELLLQGEGDAFCISNPRNPLKFGRAEGQRYRVSDVQIF